MRIFSPIIFLTLIAVAFSACGYKPSSKFARESLGEKISTSIVISLVDPENSVIVKDAIDLAIVSVFHASLVDKAYSDSHLVLSLNTPKYTPIEYDSNGFVIGYRMSLILKIKKYNDGLQKKYTCKGTHDFSITPNAILTDQERFDAIKLGAQKAMNSFIAQVSVEGVSLSK